MARLNVSIPEEYKHFLEREGYSPSKLLRQKIEEKMREKGYMADIAVDESATRSRDYAVVPEVR